MRQLSVSPEQTACSGCQKEGESATEPLGKGVSLAYGWSVPLLLLEECTRERNQGSSWEFGEIEVLKFATICFPGAFRIFP